ncbi:hypothetical protein PoB_006715200 [Plakobranchus ocellatus]|uniref:MATH domain-containing protein n=1 Tax=Plakobranchus ocellatus TaxID=259542 RepID=A0AAV4D926_9GAST|nr:hypothetical protein PoB_006715200 [Plakobranchus ocellatus]
MGFGESNTRMDLKQISPNGTRIAVPSVQMNPYRISYVQGIFWEFEAQESSGDVNGMTKFVCSVNNDIHGTRDDYLFKVYTTLDPSIVSEQSYVRVEADQVSDFFNLRMLNMQSTLLRQKSLEATFS